MYYIVLLDVVYYHCICITGLVYISAMYPDIYRAMSILMK
jgi:hypothetical protein